MKVPRNVFIHLNGFDIDTLMALFVEKCASDWKITQGFEKYTATPDKSLFCSRCGNDNDQHGSRLSLFRQGDDTLCIRNIIAYEFNQSSCYRCNRILEGFYTNIVLPAIVGLPVTAELTIEEVSLSDLLGPEIAGLLATFSRLANKSTGSCHPCDRKSWCDFILAVHRSGKGLNADLLAHTLEEEGWSPEAAQSLAAEFEFGLALLRYHEDDSDRPWDSGDLPVGAALAANETGDRG